MPTARPIMKIMFFDKEDDTHELAKQRGGSEGDDNRRHGQNDGHNCCHQGTKHYDQYDQCDGYPEGLALRQSILGYFLKVLRDGSLARDQDLEVGLHPGLVHEAYDTADVVGGIVELSCHGKGNDGSARSSETRNGSRFT